MARTTATVVCELLRITWRSVSAVVDRVIADRAGNTDMLGGLKRIGIDEIAHRRGHRSLTCVVDHDSGRLVWAAPGRNSETLDSFFQALGTERAAQFRRTVKWRTGCEDRISTTCVTDVTRVADGTAEGTPRFAVGAALAVGRLLAQIPATKAVGSRPTRRVAVGRALLAQGLTGGANPLLLTPCWNLVTPRTHKLLNGCTHGILSLGESRISTEMERCEVVRHMSRRAQRPVTRSGWRLLATVAVVTAGMALGSGMAAADEPVSSAAAEVGVVQVVTDQSGVTLPAPTSEDILATSPQPGLVQPDGCRIGA